VTEVESALCLAGFTICALVASFCCAKSPRGGYFKRIVRKATGIITILLLAGLVFAPTQATTVTEYVVPGNPGLWDLSVNGTVVAFTESAGNNVGYLFLSNNSLRQIPVPTPNSFPMGIAIVPWTNATISASAVFTESYGNKIGVMASNSTRKIAEYTVPTPGSGLRKILYDRLRDTVWFTEYAAGKLGSFCFTVDLANKYGGRFSELLLPGAGIDSTPVGIAIGADLTVPEPRRPHVWVADFGRKSIVRVYPERGECREYSVAPFSPWDVAVDVDGFVWFTGQKLGTDVNIIGRLDPVAYEQGKWAFTIFSVPTPNSEVRDIEIDARRNIWFTEYSDYASKIGKYSPLTNTFSEYQIITPTAKPQGLAIYTEPSGAVNVWFTEYAGRRIGRIRQPEGPTVSTTVYSITSAVTTSSTVTTSFDGLRPRTTGSSTVIHSTATATNASAPTASSTIVDTMSVVITSPTYWSMTYTYTTSTSFTTMTTTYTVSLVSVETTSTTTSVTATYVSTSWESVTTLTTATAISISWFSETTSTTTTATQVSTIFSPTVTMPTTTTARANITLYSPTVTLTSTALTETSTTTTSTSATTTTSYSPTVTLTSTATTFTTFLPIRPCIIASAAYGSELAPEVQSLRVFRDMKVLSTFAGAQFMNIFNAFYYSFSPTVASTVASSLALTAVVRVLLYPLVWVLQASSLVFSTLALAPEVGIVVTGVFGGALFGVIYVAPPVLGISYTIKKKNNIKNVVKQALSWRRTGHG